MVNLYRSPRKAWRYLTYIFFALVISSTIFQSSITPALALDAPQPQYPTDYADTTSVTDPPVGAPSFRWSAVPGAISYRLQVDNDSAFTSPIFLDITTPNSSFTPWNTNTLFADGEWYWQVRVESPTPVSAWSPIMHFTKTWATLDTKPGLIGPADGAQLAFYDSPVFSWTRVMGAAKYRLQIATDPGFAMLIPNNIPDTLTASYQPEFRLANGTYYWRIIPMDAFDHFGTVSEVRSFTMAYGTADLDMVPALLEPADGSFPTFTPTFHWTAVIGAEHYVLEYTSDETCDFSIGVTIETRQTSYTPTDTFPNDKMYCWHVRVDSGSAAGDWSDTWHFQKRWYLQPQLLTPTNLYQMGLYPLYSWTPVPGASRYKIEIDDEPSFASPIETRTTANTTYTPQSLYVGSKYYYWRVTPIDGGGELGLTSAVAEYQSYYDSTAPILIYPMYYYIPNDPVYYNNYEMNPHEDRTAAYPIFMWHRVMVPSPTGGVFADAYRIEVDTTPYFTGINKWQYDTENTSVTPINGVNDFSPVPGTVYYWRVCVLDHLGGSCLTGPRAGWSQTWLARFDPTYDSLNPNPWVLPPTQGDAPQLLRPAHGQESVEATPLLEWWPYETMTQTQYIVEVSRDADFSTYEISETVNIPAYSPSYSLAQRSLDRTDYGTFYWRVKGKVNDLWSNWSETRRFQIASQSEWRYIRNLGSIDNQLLIGDDPAKDVITTTTDVLTSTYDLTKLFASQSSGFWFLGFNVDLTTTNTTYVFYIDVDNVDGSGAAAPPSLRPYDVTTIPAHQPEYAVYVDKIGGVINAANTWVFAWNGVAWGFGQRLSNLANAAITASDGFVELKLPNAAIGMSNVTNSFSVTLFSVDADGYVKDTVPSDASVPADPGITPELSRFSTVSEHMNLVYPPNTASGDPTTEPSLLPFYWDWPTGSDPSSPWAGSKLEVHLDPGYTNLIREFHEYSTDSYFGENNGTFMDDLQGDNIYYWRVQPRYLHDGFSETFGAWTDGWSFRRLGFTPTNLKTSVTWATPTFSWDMVEGATTYKLQVSIQANFGTRVIEVSTPMNSYTPPGTLAQGLYYWRVQAQRFNSPANDWSEVKQFNLLLPAPMGLTPTDDLVVPYIQPLCWIPLVKLNDVDPFEPILTAWKYRVQVSKDVNFSVIYDWIDTYNNCWTPRVGYDDGKYYWHVAMIDGNGKFGPYSGTSTFIKQYPITTLISPINETTHTTPTFIWLPVDGAATYRFEVSKFPTFSPTYDSTDTYNTQFTPTKKYDPDVIYYWRIAIRDRNGKQGPFTGTSIIVKEGYKIYSPYIKK